MRSHEPSVRRSVCNIMLPVANKINVDINLH